MALELRGVSRGYIKDGKRLAVLESVSLSVGAGDFTVVQGPSGSGKSTLLLIAGTMLRPDAGVVRVCAQDPYVLTSDRRADLRARRIGFVFQSLHLVPYLTVLQNVLTATLPGPIGGAARRAGAMLDDFGLTHRLHHRPAELSVGECQRTALVRALLREPAVVLADEPTGNLDPDNTRFLLATLKEYSRDHAVLLATHDEGAARYATRLVRIQDGALVEAGA